MINSQQQPHTPHFHQEQAFHKGMTLDEYLAKSTVNNDNYQQGQDFSYENSQNLYETSHNKQMQKNSNRIITFLIKQTDEDNYEESQEKFQNYEKKFNEMQKSKQRLQNFQENINYQIQKQSSKTIQDKKLKENNTNFRVRQQSNSPYKGIVKQVHNFSPNKIFSQTLQLNNWRIHHEPQNQQTSFLPFSSTIYTKINKNSQDNETTVKNQSQNKLQQALSLSLGKKSKVASTSHTNIASIIDQMTTQNGNIAMLMNTKNKNGLNNKNNNNFYKDKKVLEKDNKYMHFHQKNMMEMQHINKYERQLTDKYQKYEKILPGIMENMRIQGIKDRLIDRKQGNIPEKQRKNHRKNEMQKQRKQANSKQANRNRNK